MGGPGTIAFSTEGYIYTMNPDGSSLNTVHEDLSQVEEVFMPAEENRAIVRRLMEGAYTNPEVHDELVADDYVGHFPPNPTLHGPEDLKRFNAEAAVAFPDVRVTIEDLLAEEDKVVIRWTLRGTHRGELRGGIPATGRRVEVSGITISRIEGGKVVENWGNYDLLGMLQQLGVVPAQDSAAE